MLHRSEPQGAATILEAAQRLFLQWGYSGTSTAALATELGLTKAALYYHFSDKEALFLAVVSAYLSEVAQELANLAPRFDVATDSQALEALALIFLSRHETSARMQQLSFQESRHLSSEGKATLSRTYHESMVTPVSRLLARAVEHGWLRPVAPDEPPAIWIFLGLLTAFLTPGHQGGTPREPSPAAFVRLFQGALRC